jgi:hypothetical protein
MNLTILDAKYSIYKFKIESSLPAWIYSSEFYSITKSREEVSVVTLQADIASEEIICRSDDWRIIKIDGQLDFNQVGIIADLSAIFRKENIPIFTLSTYDTDYILVKQKDLYTGITALAGNGHNISPENKKTMK